MLSDDWSIFTVHLRCYLWFAYAASLFAMIASYARVSLYLAGGDRRLPDVADDTLQKRKAPIALMPEGLSIGDFIDENIKKVRVAHVSCVALVMEKVSCFCYVCYCSIICFFLALLECFSTYRCCFFFLPSWIDLVLQVDKDPSDFDDVRHYCYEGDAMSIASLSSIGSGKCLLLFHSSHLIFEVFCERLCTADWR